MDSCECYESSFVMLNLYFWFNIMILCMLCVYFFILVVCLDSVVG